MSPAISKSGGREHRHKSKKHKEDRYSSRDVGRSRDRNRDLDIDFDRRSVLSTRSRRKKSFDELDVHLLDDVMSISSRRSSSRARHRDKSRDKYASRTSKYDRERDDIEARLSRARRERRKEDERERLRLEAKERERTRLAEEKRKREAEERKIREKIEKRRIEKEMKERAKREKEEQKREKKRKEKQRKEEEARKAKAEAEKAARKAKAEAEELRKKAEKKKQKRASSRLSKRSMVDSDDENIGRNSVHSRRSSFFDNLNSDNDIDKMNFIKEESSRPASRTSQKSKSIVASLQMSEDEEMPSMDSDSSHFNAYEKLRLKTTSQTSNSKKSSKKKAETSSSSSSSSDSDSDSESIRKPTNISKSKQGRKETSDSDTSESSSSDSEQSVKVDKSKKMNLSNKVDNSSIKQAESGVHSMSEYRWGFSAEEAYALALQFYRKNVDKAFTPQYSQKVHLHALMKLIYYGPYHKLRPRQLPPAPGWFDIFGHEQLEKWKQLRLNKNEAKLEFIDELAYIAKNSYCPFMAAHQKEREEKIRREEEAIEMERLAIIRMKEREKMARKDLEMLQQLEAEEREIQRERLEKEKIEMERKRSIMNVLNSQTQVQFQQYASQQHPGDLEQQNKLIEHLQEGHYNQYLSQLKSQGYNIETLLTNENSFLDFINSSNTTGLPGGYNLTQVTDQTLNIRPKRNQNQGYHVEEASIFTRPHIREFKERIKQENECVQTVNRGESLTVRVPTHDDGAILWWEFATDSYDIGFGIYFQWDDDELDDENYEEEDYDSKYQRKYMQKQKNVEIVGMYRRDSQIEVQAGSHEYPGHGTYILKFDNSFSMWRSKTLYYRVYYTR